VRDEDIIDMDAYCDQSYWIDPATGEKHHLTPELFIAGSSWQFAKTMAHMPHEYTVRDLDFKYWTMGSPIAITTILNRARLEPEKVDPIFAQRLLS
jgi:hypothetical protein